MNEEIPSLFGSFVEDCGGRQQAAEKLNCSYQLVCHILTGERGISKDIAEAVENLSNGKYCKAELLWGRTDNKSAVVNALR